MTPRLALAWPLTLAALVLAVAVGCLVVAPTEADMTLIYVALGVAGASLLVLAYALCQAAGRADEMAARMELRARLDDLVKERQAVESLRKGA